MMNSNLYDDYTPVVDIPLNTYPLRTKPTNTSFPKPTGKYDVDVLCKVLPSLIQWRLFVFYAPFYTGKDFEHPMLTDTFRHSSVPSHQPTPHPRSNNAPVNPISKYAAHKARNKAYAILKGFLEEVPQIDFIELNRRYLCEKRSFQCRNRLLSIKCTAFLPTLKILVAVSKHLDIPLRQFELALEMYVQYVEMMQKGLLQPEAHPKTAFEKLSSCHVAASRQWQILAQIVYGDTRDVSTFSIFPRRERDRKAKGDELLTFRHAVSRCCSRYFADLEVETQRCGRGRSCDGASGRHTRRDVAPEYDYNEDDRQSGIAVSCVGSALCFFMFARLPRTVLGMHVGSRYVCRKARRVRYRLSRAEEALMDGSFELTQQMTRAARKNEGRVGGTADSSWKNSNLRRPQGAEVLEPISEEGEEVEF